MTNVRSAWCFGLVLAVTLAVWTGRASAVGGGEVCKDAPAGTACELDQDKCTPDACNGQGFCAPAGPPVGCHGPVGQCDRGKSCDPETGSCVDLPDVPAGTPCEGDRNKCTRDKCNGDGFCIPGPPKSCDDEDVCTDDACDPATGACRNVEDPSNDPICVPGPDVEVDKHARCECKDDDESTSDDESGKGKDEAKGDAASLGDGSEDDGVVFCKGSDDDQSGDEDADECTISYKITVSNKSAGAVGGVQVADVLPDAVTYLASSATQGLYDPVTGIWDVGALGSAGMAMLSIEVATGGGSPDGALVGFAALRDHDDGSDDSKSDDHASDDKSDDHRSDDESHDDKSDDRGSDDESDDHASDDSKSDDESEDSKSHDSKSDDESSDDDRERIVNCADLVAVDPADTNPTNDSDCVVVKVVGRDDCWDRLPPRLGRNFERSSRLLTDAARADSSVLANKLVRKAVRTIERTSRGMAKLNRRGSLSDGCFERLGADMKSMANEARHLAP